MASHARRVDDVSVNVGGVVTDIWGSFTIPAKSTAVLTETSNFNFDTSDEPSQSCTNDGVIPVISVTVHSGTPVTQVFTDTDQVLNTGGVDPASCGGFEEHGWDRATPGQS